MYSVLNEFETKKSFFRKVDLNIKHQIFYRHASDSMTPKDKKQVLFKLQISPFNMYPEKMFFFVSSLLDTAI